MPEAGSVVVVGRGASAMATALLLARHGWSATLVGEDAPRAESAHILVDAAVLQMRENLPGLEEDLLARGARRLTAAMNLQHEFGASANVRPEDHALALLCCRGSLLHDALRRRVDASPAIAVRAERVVGLLCAGRRVTGVRAESGDVPADVVIDASGARSARREWLRAAGLPCDTLTQWGPRYNALTRFYRHDDASPLHFRFIASDGARGGLLPLDHGRFALNFVLPEHRTPADPDEAQRLFERLADAVPGARALMASPVAAHQILRGLASCESDFYDRRAPTATLTGLFPLGDAAWPGNPIYARGFALSLMQAAALRGALTRAADAQDAVRLYRESLPPIRALWKSGAFNELADAPLFSSPGALVARAARGYFMHVLRPRMRRDPELMRRFMLMYHLRLPPHRMATLRQHLQALLLR